MESGMNDYKYIHLIDKIELCVLGNDEIERMSVLDKGSLGIEFPDLNDKMDIKRGGLIDTRMGTTDNSIRCGTCGLGINHCIGHFGHITLAKYVFNIGYLPFVKKILSVICLRCSKLLIPEKDMLKVIDYLKNKPMRIRMSELKNKFIKNATHCSYCGGPISKIKLETKAQRNINLIAEYNVLSTPNSTNVDDQKKKIRYQLTSDICYTILYNINNFDSGLMGFDPLKSRPEDLIYKNFPVPPVQVRPSVRGEGQTPKQDDLTQYLSDIVKANKQVRNHEANVMNKYSHDYGNLLQHYIKSYYDDESTLLAKSKKKTRQRKSLVVRLKGKEGRFRANLQGKRVDFSARTVITPDALMEIDQLGVPIAIARNLTFPEIVTHNNIRKLEQLVKNGRDIYPGANFVIPVEKFNKRHTLTDLRYGRNEVILKIGDIVERHLVDGDIVLFNRQPSLHMQSMMSHRVKVIQDENIASFRLNLAILKPYGADFDGDEMNMIAPQNIQSQYELAELTHVKYQIISPTSSSPIIGIVLDGLIGFYNMTARNISINWRNSMNFLASTFDKINEMKIIKHKIYSGNEIASHIIPEKINYPEYGGPNNFKTTIKNGNIINGFINKNFIGTGKKNNLIHNILNKYGHDRTLKFLNACTNISINFNLFFGFTINIKDVIMPSEIKKQMKILLETRKLEVSHMLTNAENNRGMIDKNELESILYNKLNNITHELSKIVQNILPKNNNFFIMMDSETGKDAISRVGQIVGCVGQQRSVDYKRMPLNDMFRCLNYFYQNEDVPLARGFVESSFVDGMTFPETVYAHTVGRDGLIDTAMKTAETGYLYRKMSKSQEDIVVKYDGTVRTAKNGVIQFIYGNLGVDVRKQHQHTIDLVEMSDDQIHLKYKFDKTELKKYKFDNNDIFCDTIIEMRNLLFDLSAKSNLDYIAIQKNYMLPINIPTIIDTVINNTYDKHTILDPNYIYDMIHNLLLHENTPIVCSNNKKSIKHNDELVAKTIFKIALYYFIAPKICIITHKLSKEAFDDIMEIIMRDFKKAIVEPGLMVGILSAESIGEPTTQLTISSFHSAGAGIARQGLVRIQELIGVRKNIKKPTMIIYLKDDVCYNDLIAKKIKSHLDFVTFNDLSSNIEFIYDPNPDDDNSKMKMDNVSYIFKKLSTTEQKLNSAPWLIRIELNKEMMFDKSVVILDIKKSFHDNWNKKLGDFKSIKKEEKIFMEKIIDYAILSNDDNNDYPVVHIRLRIQDDFNIKFINGLLDLILKFKIKGMTNINGDIRISEEFYNFFNNTTHKIDKKKQNVIYTNGINLHDARYLKYIDNYKTRCNDINIIYDTFGIEAARTVLLKEIYHEMSGSDNIVFQHFTILVDMMTSRGTIVSVDRHGFNKQEMDVFARASFEKSVDQLISAAAFCESDTLDCVSSRIMTGLIVKSGTGLCDLILDTDMIVSSEINDVEISHKNIQLFPDTYISDIINRDLDDEFHIY